MGELKEHKLLGSYDDATLRLWTLRDQLFGKMVFMKPDFDVAWDNNGEAILVAPTGAPCVMRVSKKTKSEDLFIQESCETTISGISKCGKYIAASASSGEVYLYCDGVVSLPMSKIMKERKGASKLKVEVLQKEIIVTVGFDRCVVVWKCKEENFLIPNHEEKIEFLLNDRLVDCYILSEELVTVTQNGSVKKYSLRTGKLVDEVYKARLDVMICDTDLSCKNVIATLDSRRNILNFHSLINNEHIEVRLTSIPSCCSFSASGMKLVVGFSSGLVEVRDAGEVVSVCCGSGESVFSVCVSEEGLVGAATKSRVLLVTAAGNTGQAKLSVRRLVMCPDNATIFTVDTQGHLHLINDLKNPAQTHQLSKPTHLSYRPKGKHSLSLP